MYIYYLVLHIPSDIYRLLWNTNNTLNVCSGFQDVNHIYSTELHH